MVVIGIATVKQSSPQPLVLSRVVDADSLSVAFDSGAALRCSEPPI
ncbi:hypothetical protein SynPROSU1_02144 [Synechococcus sp. PROS-U-1]|nr:hypothetical protein SynPROSU1_02144 [Synechococcus sp. PROS-U-1]